MSSDKRSVPDPKVRGPDRHVHGGYASAIDQAALASF